MGEELSQSGVSILRLSMLVSRELIVCDLIRRVNIVGATQVHASSFTLNFTILSKKQHKQHALMAYTSPQHAHVSLLHYAI
jgi:hypothetical protein